MGTRLEGKVALVTGSTSGIGRATAELFTEQGASVVINDNRGHEFGAQVVDGIVAKGRAASYFRADVSKSDEVRELIRFAVDKYGRLDILMNNAYSGRSASVVDMEEQDWDAVFAVTVKACAISCQCAIPEMIKAGGGAIINVASVHGLLAGRRNAPYNALKAALINLTRQMAVDYGQYGIRANAICPGRILSERKVAMLRDHPEEVRLQKLVYPLGRPGTMGEVALAALFLASDESSFVTGHALVVDGGLTAQLPDAAAAYVEQGLMAELNGDPA
jgi:NAD(P)-dependent dehydrogenase (short-subunit alcohol dehydrogenase family)